MKCLKLNKIFLKGIAEEVGIKYQTLRKHLGAQSIPLKILKVFEKRTKIPLRESINFVTHYKASYKIKIPKKVSSQLAKSIGAIIADGHLRKRKSDRGKHYELVIREGYETNIQKLKEWLQEIFKLQISIKKGKNHYFIYLSNKILYLFFTQVIGIPSGRKARIVRIPECIKRSSKRIKRAFLQGLFMFDGSVQSRNGYVELTSVSRRLLKETNSLFEELGLKTDFKSKKKDKLERYKIRFRKKEKLAKLLFLFSKNTEKRRKLEEHLFGLNHETDDIEEAIEIYKTGYPKIRPTSITFAEVIQAVKELKVTTRSQLEKRLKKKKTVICEYLATLERWKVLKSERKDLNKVYKLSKVIRVPRRNCYEQ